MLKEKLRSSRGETLTEVLISIVICSIAVLLLATMVITAMSINHKAREMDVDFYGKLTDVEAHFSTGETPCVVSVKGGGVSAITFSNVRSYTSQDGTNLTVYGKGVTP